MNYNRIKENILIWAEDRGIMDAADVSIQEMKVGEERGQVLRLLLREEDDKIIPKLGDLMNTLIVFGEMSRRPLEAQRYMTFEGGAGEKLLDRNSIALKLARVDVRDTSETVRLCAMLAHSYNVPLHVCLDKAWRKIKNWEGRTTLEGTFIHE